MLLHDAIHTPQHPEATDRSEMIDAVRMLLEALSPRYRFVTVPTLLNQVRVIRAWYKPPDRAFLAGLPNRDRYTPDGRRPQNLGP